jgi:hypothetical protein
LFSGYCFVRFGQVAKSVIHRVAGVVEIVARGDAGGSRSRSLTGGARHLAAQRKPPPFGGGSEADSTGGSSRNRCERCGASP